ncbi:putative Origin recognition complex subunit 2 [Hypsibius exemplaris]|uniref:Origin recognition complex subunit 2 n=1 Tax=Hypsibius exemplaris TaxID=2072580 RepID=A0A1W0XB10_HYPEX|nr:putative Origin recognition complex subunit 2 [Hypsibius exemplaris]
MPRTYTARETLSMLDDAESESDIELAPVSNAKAGKKNDSSMAKKTVADPADDEMDGDWDREAEGGNGMLLGNENAAGGKLVRKEEKEDEKDDEPNASQHSTMGRPRSKRRSHRSPMFRGGRDSESGSETSEDDWPTFNVRKSLKGDFDALAGKSHIPSLRTPTKKDATLAEESFVEEEELPNLNNVGADTTLVNDSQISEGENLERECGRYQEVYMCQAEVAAVMETVEDPWKSRKEALLSRYEQLFPEWIMVFRLQKNILLHGVGSKRTLLETFRGAELSDESVLVIDGFDQQCDLVGVLRSFCESQADCGPIPKQPAAVFEAFRTFIDDIYADFYIILHNIDGQGLRTSAVQTLLSDVAALPQVHLIASIDHPGLPLLWGQSELNQFQWVYYHTSTFADYTEFPVPDLTAVEGKTTAVALTSLRHVFESLNPNAKLIYREIAKFQVNEDKDDPADSELGMPYKELYRVCRNEFYVSSDSILRKQLVEYYDHSLLKSKRGPDGLEYLRIPLSEDALKKFLETTA